MPDVFISYKVSPGTSALVRRIADELEGMGISCWYAPRNTDPGAFVPSILAAIDRCKAFVMVLDEGANSSGYVYNETVEAWKRYYREKKPLIIPFKIGTFEAARELSFYLSAFHIVNGGASVETADTEELIRKTSALFHKVPAKTVKSGVAPQSPPAPSKFEPQPAPAEIIERGYCGDNVTYTLDVNGVLTIVGNGSMRNFRWDGKETFYSAPWWDKRETIFFVKIQNDVTSIGDLAFLDCAELESVIIPDSVTAIGYRAFDGCKKLKSVNLPNSVTSIENGTFWQCVRLTNIVIPDSVTYIRTAAFYGCVGLTSVIIPDSVTSIDWCAFDGCKRLKSVSVPAKAQIDEYAFPTTVRIERRE